jgi:hypothetical protein
VAPDLGGLTEDVEAGDLRPSGCGRQQRGEHLHGHRLAGPVGPEQAEDLAGLHGERQAVHGGDVAEAAGERLRGHDRGGPGHGQACSA